MAPEMLLLFFIRILIVVVVWHIWNCYLCIFSSEELDWGELSLEWVPREKGNSAAVLQPTPLPAGWWSWWSWSWSWSSSNWVDKDYHYSAQWAQIVGIFSLVRVSIRLDWIAKRTYYLTYQHLGIVQHWIFFVVQKYFFRRWSQTWSPLPIIRIIFVERKIYK